VILAHNSSFLHRSMSQFDPKRFFASPRDKPPHVPLPDIRSGVGIHRMGPLESGPIPGPGIVLAFQLLAL